MSQLVNILKNEGISTRSFPATSRYYGIETSFAENKNKESIVYLRRRFVPQSDRFSLIREYTVEESDRIDNITHQFLGDPEQFWQLCDANSALHPRELTETVGARIRITLPADIPGNMHV